VKEIQRTQYSDFSPRGVSAYSRARNREPLSKEQEFFERVVAAATLCHMRGKPMDAAALVTEDEGLPLQGVQELIRTPLFVQAMTDRGIPITDSRRLSYEQIQVLRTLSDVSLSLSERERVEALGVQWNKFQGWLEWAPFRELYNETTVGALRTSIAPARVKLAEAMAKGSPWAIKYGFEVTGEYNPAAQQVQDLQLFMQMMMTVLQRRITDDRLLFDISNDLRKLADANSLDVLEIAPATGYAGTEQPSVPVEPDDNVHDPDPQPDAGEPGHERAVLDGDGQR